MTLPKIKRNKEIVKRIKQGDSFQTVAKDYNIKKQTVHEIYHREINKQRQDISTEGA